MAETTAGTMALPTEQEDKGELKSTGYELFILLLSIVSIFNMLIYFIYEYGNEILITVTTNTARVIEIINIILTIFFLFDFFYRILTTSSKSGYFFRRYGWADLLACIPQFRIFRTFRIFRAYRLLKRFGVRNMLNELVNNRAGSALYITMFLIIVVAEVAAVYVLKFEANSTAPNVNLTSAGDAVWWVFVTLTTVGYGDFYPTTAGGRLTGVFVMFSGVALIGVLASFLANFFLAPPKTREEEPAGPGTPAAVLKEIRDLLDQQEQTNAAVREKLAEYESLLK